MIGLAAVLLLIGLAAAVFATATHERPLAFGTSARTRAEVRQADNASAPAAKPTNEPLAELGVAPSTTSSDANATDVVR